MQSTLDLFSDSAIDNVNFVQNDQGFTSNSVPLDELVRKFIYDCQIECRIHLRMSDKHRRHIRVMLETYASLVSTSCFDLVVSVRWSSLPMFWTGVCDSVH